jgi:hypothetical protein
MEMIGHVMWVWVATAISLVVPPWMVAGRITPRHSGWQQLLMAFALGCASQGILGLFWDRLILAYPMGELAVYLTFWAVASLAAWRFQRTREIELPLSRSEAWGLGLIVAAAVIIRTIHPVAHSALGQSDAYSHLQFIRQILADGMIHNQIYPPAFSWIMALPALLFRVDPYWIARFGGATWGAALVLALFALGRLNGRQGAGWLAAALVAFCPAWMPLLKTGVGIFANQSGLFFIPLILWAWLQVRQVKGAWLLLIFSLALAAVVPMMWISLIPVLVLDRLLAGGMRESRWWRTSIRILLILLPGALLLTWQAARIQGNHEKATVAIVTAAPMPEAGEATPDSGTGSDAVSIRRISPLLHNYLSYKRAGYGDTRLNVVGWGLGIAFALTLLAGMRTRRSELRLLGAWGVITSLQAGTGWLQFTGYQREGWSLLLASAWLFGVMGAELWRRWGRRRWMMIVALAGLAVCLVWTCRFPPGHVPSLSAAEDDLVNLARKVARHIQQHPHEKPLTFVTRKVTEFHGNQGDILSAVLPPDERVSTLAVGPDQPWQEPLDPQRQYLVVMDQQLLTKSGRPGMFSRIQPDQVAQFEQSHQRLFRVNEDLRNRLNTLPSDRWVQARFPVHTGLYAVRISAKEGGL